MQISKTKISITIPSVYRMRQREREEEQRREDEKVEAEEVRRLAAEFAEEQRRKAEMRRQAAMKQAADNMHQLEDAELMKQIDRMQEEVRIIIAICRKLATFGPYVLIARILLYVENWPHLVHMY